MLVSLVGLAEEDPPRTQMRPISCWAGSRHLALPVLADAGRPFFSPTSPS
jgi:hypothetical protein